MSSQADRFHGVRQRDAGAGRWAGRWDAVVTNGAGARLGSCGHRHRTREKAQACAEKLEASAARRAAR